MAIGYLDIPALVLLEAAKQTKKKDSEKVCRVLPRSRFQIHGNGSITFAGLVCSPEEMGGEATGVGASVCRNCVLK